MQQTRTTSHTCAERKFASLLQARDGFAHDEGAAHELAFLYTNLSLRKPLQQKT